MGHASLKRYLSRIIGSEGISHVVIWGKSLSGRGNRQCKGPEVGEGTGRETWKTGLEPHGGKLQETVRWGGQDSGSWALPVSELEATGWF